MEISPEVWAGAGANFGKTSAKLTYGVNTLLPLSRMYRVPFSSMTKERDDEEPGRRLGDVRRLRRQRVGPAQLILEVNGGRISLRLQTRQWQTCVILEQDRRSVPGDLRRRRVLCPCDARDRQHARHQHQTIPELPGALDARSCACHCQRLLLSSAGPQNIDLPVRGMRRRQRWGEVRVFKTAKESIHNNEDLENRRFPLK